MSLNTLLGTGNSPAQTPTTCGSNGGNVWTAPLFSLVIKRGVCHFIVLVGLWGLLGCTPSYTAQKTGHILGAMGALEKVQVTRAHGWVLPSQSAIYIHYPLVSDRLERQLPRTQYAVATELAKQLEVSAQRVHRAETQVPWETAVKQATQLGCNILLKPEVILFRDTINSAKEGQLDFAMASKNAKPLGRDRLVVRLHIFDAVSGHRLDTIEAKAWAKIWQGGLAQPTDLTAKVASAIATTTMPFPQKVVMVP